MSSGYTIDFTDRDPNRSFNVKTYTTNGPRHPTTPILDSHAVSAATSLLLYGKGSPNYGERIQENLIHLLEHFAGPLEPVYPINGQMWMNTALTPAQLHVYNAARREILTDVDHPADASWIAIAPQNPTDQATMVARFQPGRSLRLFDISTNKTHTCTVITCEPIATCPPTNISPRINTAGNVAFQISPIPAAGTWFVGGWDPVLQNNTKLHDILDAGLWNIVNLGEPTQNDHATTKLYVDNAILTGLGTVGSISSMSDTSIIAAADGDILLYGSGVWENVPSSSLFLSLAGGSVTGNVVLSGNYLRDVADPVQLQDAATKKYVDDAISLVSGGGPGDLDSLSDVFVTSPVPTGSVLTFTGAGVWQNQNIASFISSNSILTFAGGSLTGPLYLANNPFVGNEAATKDYVDAEVAAGILGAQDGVVDGAFFNPTTRELTLTRTNGLPNVTASLVGAGGTANNIQHDLYDPNEWLNNIDDSDGFALESRLYVRPLYPTIDVADAIDQLSMLVGQFVPPVGRLVFTSTGGTIINFDAGSVAGQLNPALSSGAYEYAVGSNRLSIYINGVKQYASEHGRRVVEAAAAIPEFYLWPGTRTGLNPANTYNFNVSVNGQAPVNVSIIGSDAVSLGNLANAINIQTDANYHDAITPDSKWAFGVRLFDGAMVFYSSLPGTNSSIDLTDGSTGNPLFSNIVGDASSTGTFTIADVTIAGDNFYSPTDLSYKEVGRVGRKSQAIEMTTTVPAGAVVEVLIEPDLFVENIN